MSPHARERECGKMHFSDARVLPHRHPLRACPLPSLPLRLPRPPHPGVFIDVYLDLLRGGGPGGFSAIRGSHRAEVSHPTRRGAGRNPLSAFYLTVAQGRGRPDFIVASWEQLGLLLPCVYHRPLTKRAACIFLCLHGAIERERPGFLIVGCVSIVQDIR